MRARVMGTSRKLLLIVAAYLLVWTAIPLSTQAQSVRNIFMNSNWDFLPPFLETEENLSLYMAHEGNGGPGQESYSRFGGTQHLFLPDGVVSFNGEGFVTNDGLGGASVLFHSCQLIGGALFGAGASFIVQESSLDNTYEQGGVHVEIFPNDVWSFRANGYVPTGQKRRQIFDSELVF